MDITVYIMGAAAIFFSIYFCSYQNKSFKELNYKKEKLRRLRDIGVLTNEELQKKHSIIEKWEQLEKFQEDKEALLKLKEAGVLSAEQYSNKMDRLNNYYEGLKEL